MLSQATTLLPLRVINGLMLCLCLMVGPTALANSPGSLFPDTPQTSLFQEPAATEDDFLTADEAFQVSAELDGRTITLRWHIADGYYLYKHRFNLELIGPPGARLSPLEYSKHGKIKQDPNFGEVEAFYKEVSAKTLITELPNPEDTLIIKVRYQGCADQGLCYIPQYKTFEFTVTGVQADQPAPTPAVPPSSDAGTPPETATGLARLLSQSSFLSIIGIFFILGIGLTFTPCVLPMVPILTSIIVGQGRKMNHLQGFTLSSIYVLGMAITYALAGAIAGTTGNQLQLYMQQPAVLFGFAFVFLVLSFSMFGFYELEMPSSLQNKLNSISQKQQGGTYLGVAIMGVISALVVSPCVSAPLAGALLYIGNNGDPVLGAAALFSLGLGMGAPLIAVGTTGGNFLPKAGGWMDSVKGVFGVLLLGVALWLIKHLLPDWLEFTLWGGLLILAGIYLGALNHSPSHKAQLFRGVGITILIAGIALIFHTLAPSVAAQSQTTTAPTLPFKSVRTLQQLENTLASAKAQGQPVFLDYYADWCISCVEMEHEAFSQPEVQALLSNHLWVQVDLTNNDEDKALLDRFELKGPPSMLFFDAEGNEIRDKRLYAYTPKQRFIHHIKSL